MTSEDLPGYAGKARCTEHLISHRKKRWDIDRTILRNNAYLAFSM